MSIVLYLLVQVVRLISRDAHWLENSWLLCFSNFHNRNTCLQQTECVLDPSRRNSASWCLLQMQHTSRCGFMITTSGALIFTGSSHTIKARAQLSLSASRVDLQLHSHGSLVRIHRKVIPFGPSARCVFMYLIIGVTNTFT